MLDERKTKITPPDHPPFDVSTLEEEILAIAPSGVAKVSRTEIPRRFPLSNLSRAGQAEIDAASMDVSSRPSDISEAKRDVDLVNHPPHYTTHPSGVECITITRHMNFNKGNAMKYIWRAGDKGNEIEDLRKAAWYIADEIARLEALRDD
jgi:hypothetical protein